MMQSEAAEKTTLTTPDNGGTNTDEGVWVESFSPVMPGGYQSGQQSVSGGGGGGGGGSYRGYRGRRYGGEGGRTGAAAPPPVATTPSPAAVSGAIEVTNVSLVCRGINRPGTANSDLAYSVSHFLTNSPSFAAPVTLGPIVTGGDDTNTFTFDVTVNLRKPFKLQ
jgi:hypothetical protein